MKILQKCLLFCFSLIIFLFITNSQVAYANVVSDPLFTTTYGEYKNQNVHYHIDYIDIVELEEETFWDRFNVIGNVRDGTVALVYDLLHTIFIQLPFFLLKFGTNGTIWLLNAVSEVNFINGIVQKMTSTVQSIAGISGGNFGSTGLFGGFLGIITVVIGLYTLYQFVVKRASISAFSSLLKSLVALVLALGLFSNYTTIINGLNTLSVETASLIISGSARVTSDGNIVSSDSAQNQMNSALWDTFVHRPYLMLQYGTMDESKIGKSRIRSLLMEEPESEDRYNKVKEEIESKNNKMMTRGKMLERFGILIVAFTVAVINVIPVLIFAFGLLFFQFWFTAMAMIAPFVLIWSAFPNQFSVLTRYLLELITPLVLKVGVAVLALIVFSLTGIVSSVSMNIANTNGGLLGFILAGVAQSVLFFTLFLLRKRILGIFSYGSRQLAHVREGMSSTFTQPAKKGVQTVATTTGAAVGAMTGGVQGAMMGANMGGTVGRTLTGEKGIGEAGRDFALAHSINESLKQRENMRLAREKQELQKQQNAEAKSQRLDSLKKSLGGSGLSNEKVEEIHNELEKQGITDLKDEEVQSAMENIRGKVQNEEMKQPVANMFAEEIKAARKKKQLAEEKEMLSDYQNDFQHDRDEHVEPNPDDSTADNPEPDFEPMPKEDNDTSPDSDIHPQPDVDDIDSGKPDSNVDDTKDINPDFDSESELESLSDAEEKGRQESAPEISDEQNPKVSPDARPEVKPDFAPNEEIKPQPKDEITPKKPKESPKPKLESNDEPRPEPRLDSLDDLIEPISEKENKDIPTPDTEEIDQFDLDDYIEIDNEK